ncbi:uncharacterized protein LOC127242405 [Andrographis paniculata]|uniref:uncharacterized protein LOC127242405 n=1 Tax=Andrographis paniculata TaxID=175694 RepID=UPI0021E7AB8A|nr:uncharacterized protein LOC127242405 [Andrographis paniculata]
MDGITFRTPDEIQKAVEYLKKKFEIKDFGKTKFCLGLQIEHLESGTFIHQSNYTKRVLKQFLMDKSHSLSTPMIVRALDPTKDPFRPKEENEKTIGPEVPYRSAISALMYLANSTRHDISFAIQSRSNSIVENNDDLAVDFGSGHRLRQQLLSGEPAFWQRSTMAISSILQQQAD